ncbi:hypothetical protein BDV23DRAFT_192392 [Aspergillus alliaceus]|uniref:Uncharacterized protein n=1 Tax=Petromyces alliaceus TaxID=209559 RepID=A0A5N7BQ54_PETAA|nr:hypothetical protein BDV23DRAFT_192392 [Aspergillus alliaceus]
MAPQSSIYPVRKRGRPQRQRQAARTAEWSAEFNQYYTPTTTALTKIDPPVTTYFPPGEITIPRELEQLLLPLSPLILPVNSASDIISLITSDKELSAPASLPTVSVEITVRSPILPRSPGSPDLPHLHVSPESVGPESPSRSYRAEISSTVQALGRQQQAEHDTQHADHTGLKDYLQQIQTEGRFPDVLQIYYSIHVTSPDPDPDPVHICLTTDYHVDTVTEVTFDINSIMGFTSSLAVAKQGILHLNPLPILHYTFGRFVGFEDISLYILFPRLYREEQQSSRFFNHSQLNSTARGIESQSQQVDPVARQQLLFYFLLPETLPLDGMIQLFQQHWNHASVSAYLSDQFYLDIGKETCPAGFSQIGNPIGQQQPYRSLYSWVQFYPISLLQDTGSLTLEIYRALP